MARPILADASRAAGRLAAGRRPRVCFSACYQSNALQQPYRTAQRQPKECGVKQCQRCCSSEQVQGRAVTENRSDVHERAPCRFQPAPPGTEPTIQQPVPKALIEGNHKAVGRRISWGTWCADDFDGVTSAGDAAPGSHILRLRPGIDGLTCRRLDRLQAEGRAIG